MNIFVALSLLLLALCCFYVIIIVDSDYYRSVDISSIDAAFRKKDDLFDHCPYYPPDPWDDSIAKYVDVKYGFETECDLKNPPETVTELNGREVVLRKGHEQYNCFARCLFYVNDKKFNTSQREKIGNATFFCDFIETDCRQGNATNRFIHMRIEEKKSPRSVPVLKRERNPDVHLIVLDSVASTHFIRALPRTANFLVNGMAAIEFRKLNKVGWNSRPAGFATLLGRTTEPVTRTLMKLKTIPPDMNHTDLCSQYLDNIPYIPNEYRKAGYKTFDAQDYLTSLLNHPSCHGMKENLLDHYYSQEIHGSPPLEHSVELLPVSIYRIPQVSDRGSFHLRLRQDKELAGIHGKNRCRGSVGNILEFLSHFVNSYNVTNSPKFSLSWVVDLAHDSGLGLYKGDYALYNFFFKNRKAEASTSFGYKEQSNPFMYLVVPTFLRDSTLYKQLKENSKELITHHDLHATLQDILYVEAKQYGSTKIAMSNTESSFFEVTFEVAPPALGKFQIPIRKELENLDHGGALFTRLDKYGKNGDCMKDEALRPYCTCKKRPENVAG
ncbi:hypothetical protein NECAME_08378 [Necator americanus]|uniref:Uncharacterized protein n=1 Tax=Necator americanus TaxID=51031 RepID=W2TIJ4_NECAM|nr:hypothetical protein NECAME_08378 [Necator americanus]ETN81633.1 hypothetical protein NECAME_08378 [Necator americanus]